MSTQIPIGSWLISKKLQYVEETSFGTPPAAPIYTQIGYNSQVRVSAPTTVESLPQPGSTDPTALLERSHDRYFVDLIYRPFDTKFAKYGVNLEGGSGTIEKSLNLTMGFLLGGSTENFLQAQGCRVGNFRIGGMAGKPITAQARIFSQLVKTPTPTNPGGTYALNPSTVPFMFKDGGSLPVSIGGVQYGTHMIQIETERNLDWLPQPGSDMAQQILPGPREIRGVITLVWRNTDNYVRLTGETLFPLVWTLKVGVSTFSLSNCRFKALDSFDFANQKTLYESYSFEARSGVLT